MKILLIDNYDSFTYNLYHYLSSLKCKVDVYRNDKIDVSEIKKNKYKKIVIAKKLMHGKTSLIKHNGKGIFKDIIKVISATRYHSLIIDNKNLSKDLIVTAETKDKIIMGVMHKKYNIHGVQFHPESIKTPEGMKLLKNFLNYK